MKRKLIFSTLLFVFSVLFLTGCNTIFLDKNATIEINGSKEKVEYTGALTGFKPQGNGFGTSKDDLWNFSACFEKGKIVGSGYIYNYPCTVTFGGREFEVYYSGEIIDGYLSGKCVLYQRDPYEKFFDGTINELQIVSGRVENITVSIIYLDEQFEGFYSGNISDGKISGNGVFEASEADFKYDGNFSDGVVSGSGRLWYDNYVVHFKEVDRKGRYNGYVENGIASGDGIFNAINSEGINYTYNGRFENGIYNGKGELTYGTDGVEKYVGTFTDGEFTPNKGEFLKWFSETWVYPFEVNGLQQSFINSHENYFQANEETFFTNLSYDKFVDTNYSYEWVATSPAQYHDRMIFTVAAVWGVIDNPTFLNENVTVTFANDYYEDNYIFLSTEPIDSFEEGENIICVGLPIDTVTISDGETSRDFLIVYTSFIMNKNEYNKKIKQYNK